METNEITSENKRKMFSFDLNQENLKKFYPGKNPTYAYTQIGAFLYKYGFEHDQGSGYVSKEPMTKLEAVEIAKLLKNKFDWINKVSPKFKISDAAEPIFDAIQLFDAMDEEKKELTNVKNKTSIKTKR